MFPAVDMLMNIRCVAHLYTCISIELQLLCLITTTYAINICAKSSACYALIIT